MAIYPASILINLTNNTGQGYITFQGLTNGLLDPVVSSGNPPLIAPTVPNGTTVAILNAGGGLQPYLAPVSTQGVATFNLPNGQTMTINWWIDPNHPGNDRVTFTVPSAYSLSGGDTPQVSNNAYTYNITLTTNS